VETRDIKALLGKLVTLSKYLLPDYQKSEATFDNRSHDHQFQEYKDWNLILKCRISADTWRKEASYRKKP